MNNRERLDLLAFPIDADLLGTVHHYEFNKRTAAAWEAVLDAYRDRVHKRIPPNLPSARLTTALRVAAGTTAYLGGMSKLEPPRFMIAGAPLQSEDLRDAAAVWEQQLLDIPEEDIRLSYPSRFADALAAIKPRAIRPASQIRKRGRQPDIPPHLYRALTWRAAELLIEENWDVDGQSIRLRADSDADLIAWDAEQLWTTKYQDRTRVYAALRIGLTVETLRGMAMPVVRLDPVVCRFTPWTSYAKTAWIDTGESKPLLKVELTAARLKAASLETLNIVAQLRGEKPPIPKDFDVAERYSAVKAPLPASSKWDIGVGVGMMTVRELAAFAAKQFKRDPLHASVVPALSTSAHERIENKSDRRAEQHALPGGTLTITTKPKPKTENGKTGRPRRSPIAQVDFDGDDDFADILDVAGCERIRVHVLYQQPHTRARMIKLICLYFGRSDVADGNIPDDEATRLGPGIEIFPEYAGALLAHGDHEQRPRLARELLGRTAPAGTRILAFCETEFDDSAWIKQRKKSRKDDNDIVNPFNTDAKPVVNRELARLHIASQSLVTAATVKAEPEGPAAKENPAAPEDTVEGEAPATPLTRLYRELQPDHAGQLAVADLFRSAGIVPRRLTDALAHGRTGIDHTVAHVGLHVREQRGTRLKKGQQPRLSWTLVALVPVPDRLWNVKAYTAQPHPDGGRTGWLDYTDALTSLHANPIPEGKRRGGELTASIDIALDQLTQHLGEAGSYLLYVSGDSTRKLWPQMANRHFDAQPEITGEIDGRIRLPGYSSACQKPPRAIVRVSGDGIPRPVKTDRSATTTKLYELDGAADTWILANVPRQYTGGGAHARLGSKETRWKAEGIQHKKTWYAQTSTEISVIEHDGAPEQYAVAAMRLCNFQLSWTGRRSYPLPVHLAMQIDKDHPDYRRTVDEPDDLDPNDHTGGEESDVAA